MKKIFATIAILCGISSAAQAGLMIEPYIGYEMGDITLDPVSGSESTFSNSGVGYGLRLGYQMLVPFLALDYRVSSGTSKPNVGTDQDYTSSSLGAVVGVDLPLIRAWAGYGFSNEATLKGLGGDADTKYKGTYTKAGIGLGFLPIVSINAEYIMNNFSKVNFGEGAGDESRSTYYDSIKNNMVFISVSAPFDL